MRRPWHIRRKGQAADSPTAADQWQATMGIGGEQDEVRVDLRWFRGREGSSKACGRGTRLVRDGSYRSFGRRRRLGLVAAVPLTRLCRRGSKASQRIETRGAGARRAETKAKGNGRGRGRGRGSEAEEKEKLRRAARACELQDARTRASSQRVAERSVVVARRTYVVPGWAGLSLDKSSGRLQACSTANANPELPK